MTEDAARDTRPATLGRVVVFVSGTRPRFEAALAEARELYPNHDFAFVTEPECRGWLGTHPGDLVLVAQQPFRPFARRASALRRTLSERPVQACILVVAGTGSESLRFRIFALRLSATDYYLLPSSISGISSRVDRWSFLGFAIAAALSRGVRAISWLDPILLIALSQATRFLPRMRSSQRTEGKPQIVHLIPHMGVGGAQRQLTLLLRNRSSEYSHRLLALSSTDCFSMLEVEAAGVPITSLDSVEDVVGHRLETRKGGQRRRVRWVWPVVASLRSCFPLCGQVVSLALYLRRLRPCPDILHCWLLLANVIGPPAARLAGVARVITSVRNIQSAVEYNYYDPRWQRIHERVTAPLADLIIANAPTVARDYATLARVPPDKIITVANGIEVETVCVQTPAQRAATRLTLGLAPEDLVVGTVARLAKEKDLPIFLRTVALARKRLPSLRAVMVGDGPLRMELEALAGALDLANGVVQFLGERHDARAIIQLYDAFLLTSFIEGMPNVVMESQLLGVPVVATRAGGTVDLIRDGETGLLAPIGDPEGLASALVQVLTDRSLHDRLSRAGEDHIRTGFTAEMLVRQTEAVYRRLLGTDEAARRVPCAE